MEYHTIIQSAWSESWGASCLSPTPPKSGRDNFLTLITYIASVDLKVGTSRETTTSLSRYDIVYHP